MADRLPRRVEPMLATLAPGPFHQPGWVYEEKYDGDRLLAYKEGASVRLLSRSGKDHTRRFPRIVADVARLRPSSLVLDGEVVVFDGRGVSRFQLLQQGSGRPVLAVFDCLYHHGVDLRREPLSERRRVLEEVLPPLGVLLLSQRLDPNGLKAYQIATRRGCEGVVAKEEASPYVAGRSRLWLKVKVRQEDEFVIAGFTAPAGGRQHFGALLLGAYQGEALRYVGKVGTGFDRASLAALHRKFQSLERRTPALVDPPREPGATFLEPRLVVQVSYQELTSDGKLRQPVFLGLREDKRPEEVVLPETATARHGTRPASPARTGGEP